MHRILGLAAIAAGTLALAQPAAAQDCKAGPFTIYFEFDRNSITPAGAAILDQAAAAYKACGRAGITIAGHTDRRGDESYNIGVSQRMASNVRAYLAGRGVPDGAMTTAAYGESRRAVETADGVSEPRNRRVEVSFGPGSGW